MSKMLRDKRAYGKLTYIFLATLVVILTTSAALFIMNQAGWSPFKTSVQTVVVETPEGEVIAPEGKTFFYEHGGQLKINIPMYQTYNSSTESTKLPYVYIFHSSNIDFDEPSADLFGMGVGDVSDITGNLFVSDNGILYLVVDHSTNNTRLYIDNDGNVPYSVSGPDPWDWDEDGIDEYRWKLDFTDLPSLAAGESQKEVTTSVYLIQEDPAPTIKSDYNSTDGTSGSWKFTDAAAYITVSDGNAIKVTKVVLDLSGGSYNHTYIDNNTVQVQWLKITAADGVEYIFDDWDFSLGGKTITFDLTSDPKVSSDFRAVEEFYGITLFKDQGEGTRFATVYLRIKAKFHKDALGDGWMPDLKISWINPAGTIATLTQLMDFV